MASRFRLKKLAQSKSFDKLEKKYGRRVDVIVTHGPITHRGKKVFGAVAWKAIKKR